MNPKRRKTDKDKEKDKPAPLKRQHTAPIGDPSDMLGTAIRLASGPGRARSLLNIEAGDDVFKIPDVPARVASRAKAKSAAALSLNGHEKGKGKQKESGEDDDDVFGSKSAKAKGKRRSTEDDLGVGDVEVIGHEVGEIEKANRAVRSYLSPGRLSACS